MNTAPCRALLFVLALLSLSTTGIFSTTYLPSSSTSAPFEGGFTVLADAENGEPTLDQKSIGAHSARTESQISVSPAFSARGIEKNKLGSTAALRCKEVSLLGTFLLQKQVHQLARSQPAIALLFITFHHFP